MITTDTSKVTLILCAVLETELRHLASKHWPAIRIKTLRSSLHMHPQDLGRTLYETVNAELAEGRQVVVGYGDCHSLASSIEAHANVSKVRASNCCALLLGEERYLEEIKRGSFFVLPEWTLRWRKVFSQDLGLNRDLAPEVMKESHKRMLYLDTQLIDPPLAELESFATFCGLSLERVTVGLEPLQSAIEEALSRLHTPLVTS